MSAFLSQAAALVCVVVVAAVWREFAQTAGLPRSLRWWRETVLGACAIALAFGLLSGFRGCSSSGHTGIDEIEAQDAPDPFSRN